MKTLMSGKERTWKFLVLFPILVLLGLGLFALGMDADSDPWMSSDAEPSILDVAVDTNLCCGPGDPPCRSTGPGNPLPGTLHRRAQAR